MDKNVPLEEYFSILHEKCNLFTDVHDIYRYLIQNIDNISDLRKYFDIYKYNGKQPNPKNYYDLKFFKISSLSVSSEMIDYVIYQLVDKYGANRVFVEIINLYDRHDFFKKFIDYGLDPNYEYDISFDRPFTIGTINIKSSLLSVPVISDKYYENIIYIINNGFSLSNINKCTVGNLLRILKIKRDCVYKLEESALLRIIFTIIGDNDKNTEIIEIILALAIIYKFTDIVDYFVYSYYHPINYDSVTNKIYTISKIRNPQDNTKLEDSMIGIGFDQDNINKIKRVLDIVEYIGHDNIKINYV
jgi:hypothetical protein